LYNFRLDDGLRRDMIGIKLTSKLYSTKVPSANARMQEEDILIQGKGYKFLHRFRKILSGDAKKSSGSVLHRCKSWCVHGQVPWSHTWEPWRTLFNYRGKYYIACCIYECRYWSSTNLFTGAGGGFDYNYVTSSLPEKAASFSNVLSEH